MSAQHRTRALAALLIAAAAGSAAFLLLRDGRTEHPVARITRGGVLLEEIELDTVSESYSFVLEDSLGSNTVLVEHGRIRVSAADCPDQVCVNQGFISDGTVTIVCLPHRLIVEIVGGGGVLDGGAG